MPNPGSIIQLHHHNNFELLEFFTETNNNLYYKNKPVYTPISLSEHNAIQTKDDGFFVDGKNFIDDTEHDILSRFSFKNANLYFDNIVVSREYQRPAIQLMIVELWEVINAGGAI